MLIGGGGGCGVIRVIERPSGFASFYSVIRDAMEKWKNLQTALLPSIRLKKSRHDTPDFKVELHCTRLQQLHDDFVCLPRSEEKPSTQKKKKSPREIGFRSRGYGRHKRKLGAYNTRVVIGSAAALWRTKVGGVDRVRQNGGAPDDSKLTKFCMWGGVSPGEWR